MKRILCALIVAAALATLALLWPAVSKPVAALQFPKCEDLQGTSCAQQLQTTQCQTFVPNSNPVRVYTYTCHCTLPHVGQPGRPYAWQCLPD